MKKFNLEQRNTIYNNAIDKWGRVAQMEMAQEEATELALAIRKFTRQANEKRKIDLAGEIADVEIMIEQMKFMLPEIQKEIDIIKVEKLTRLEKRINENNFEL